MDVIDRPGAASADHVAGLASDALMKSDPIWAQLRGEISALQALAIDTNAKLGAAVTKQNALATKYNALATKYNATATKYNATATALNTLATKLNSDAGVTDTNYAAANATDAATDGATDAATDAAASTDPNPNL